MHRRDFLLSCSAAAAALTGSNSFAASDKAAAKKRGCCFVAREEGWLERVQALRPNWMYTWGLERPEGLPAEIDFTPMLWGDWGDKHREKAIADVTARYKSGEVTHLLTFNEPDQAKQSGMTVERVIDLWPQLMDIGVPLVSPGCVHPDKEWMDTFMKEVDRRGYRVDAVSVHSYGGPSADGLVKRLEKVHERFGRPLWITEFAVGDWEAKTAAENRHSPERVAKFMREVLPALDGLECVDRYAWFSASTSSAPLGTSALVDKGNKLTALGQLYAAGADS